MGHECIDTEVWRVDRQGLHEQEATPAQAGSGLPDVRSLPLVIRQPQRVSFAGHEVLLDRQGLYMFYARGRLRWEQPEARPAVVHRAYTYASAILFLDDPNALFAALATLHVHGWTHCRMGVEQKLERMKSGLLSCTCGEVAEVAIYLLQSFGYRARYVNPMRVRGPYNAHDDSHALLEYFEPSWRKWVLVDLDTHNTFAWRGRPLHLGEVADRIHQGQPFDIVPLTPPALALLDTSAYVTPRGDQPLATFKLLSPPHLRRWYEHMLEAPAIWEGGRRWFWHPDDASAARVTGYDAHAARLSRDQWWAKFYGNQPEERNP